MNVLDSLKSLSVDQIREHCVSNTIDAKVAMINVEGDFNFSTIVRNANFFGFKTVYHISEKKKWDRRGSVGTHHYTPIEHIDPINIGSWFDEIKEQNHLIYAIENNIPEFCDKTMNLHDYTIPYDNILFLFGSENNGIPQSVLERVDGIITIPGYGSVRSLNVGTASGIVMSWQRYLLDKR